MFMFFIIKNSIMIEDKPWRKEIMKYSLTVAILMLLASTAFAELDIKLNYDFLTINPADVTAINNQTYGSSYPTQKQMMGYGGDIIYYLPINFGLGARYESYANKISGLGFDQNITASRTAVIVGYRLI